MPNDFINFAVKNDAYSVNIPINELSQDFVKKAKENSLKVFVWSVNSGEEINKAKSLGVDYICSNFPDKI